MVKVALLIGVSEYEPGLNSLAGAVKDVDAMQQVLAHLELGGFGESDIVVLKNPHRQEMEEAIEHLFAGRQKDDLLLLFFSGHGIKDDTGRLYLATRTTRKTPRGELIRSSAVPASFVHENMSRSRSKRQVVILDSCFSGAFAEGLSAKDDGTVNIREQLGGEGRAVLTSSSSTQYSFEQQGSDLSIYTHYLIEGITTGVADLDDDGVVSIDELHEYASRKVREIQPTMKPEIYTSREGFKIRLTKVPQGDPKQKYRKEVSRYMKRGEISFVGRQTLDVLKIRLGLSQEEATAIEDETLAVARQEFREKLQQYERAFSNALNQEATVSTEDLNALRQNLQQILGLRNEDTTPIEVQVTARIEAYKQHLQQYQYSLSKAMRREYPLSQATRYKLQQMQQEWQLTDKDIALIESRVNVDIEAYQQKLQQYEQAFTTAVQQQYPLSEAKHNQLWQQQQLLGLKAEDIQPITTRIISEIEAYQKKLQEYEQVLTQAIQHEYPLSEEIRQELSRYQHVSELKNEEVARIEEKVIRQREINQLQTQQLNTSQPPIMRQELPTLPKQLISAEKSQVISEKQLPKLRQSSLVFIAPLILLGLAGLLGYLLQQLLQKQFLGSIPPTPTSTQPSAETTKSSNLVRGSEITITKEISLSSKNPQLPKDKTPQGQKDTSVVYAPVGLVLQIVDTKLASKQDSWLHLRVCQTQEIVTSPPDNTKPLAKPGQDVWIQSSKLKSFNPTIAEAGSTNQCQSLQNPAPFSVSP